MNASERPTHPTTEPDSIDRPEPTRPTRNVPPLVWVIVAIFVGWLAIALFQRAGTHETPQGGETPTAAPEAGVSPATPATPDAPGTPTTVGP